MNMTGQRDEGIGNMAQKCRERWIQRDKVGDLDNYLYLYTS